MNKTIVLAAVLWTPMILFFTWGFVRGARADGDARSAVGLVIFVVGFWGAEVAQYRRRGRVELTTDRLVIETAGPAGRPRLDEPWAAVKDVSVFAVGSGPISLMVSLASGRYSGWFGGWPTRELEWVAEQMVRFRAADTTQ